MQRITMRKTMAALLLTMLMASSASAAFKFGVMADTQWIGTDDGYNPSSVSIDIIQQLNQQFISNGVKFVVQVGDLSDSGGGVNEDFRAIFAQDLYNANPQIGFFPLRGNHESSQTGGIEDVRIYPQTKTGQMSATPSDIFSLTNADSARQPFPTVAGSVFTVGANFLTPDPSVTSTNDWRGLTYSFDYDNARFVLLDQFTPLNKTGSNNPYTNAIDMQQSWIDTVLAGKPANGHAFVFSHKGLITENHVDSLFGSDPSKDAAGQDAFITSLYSHGVRYYMNGHDHMYDRALVSITTGQPTDGVSAKVQNITCASDSSKFYIPANPSNDTKYNVPAFGHSRQAQVSQELNTVGYYIFTVDGPKVNVDYYSAIVNPVLSSGEYLLAASSGTASRFTPTMTFTKRESFGYSLNGKEFLVAQGAPYSVVTDTYAGTTAKILGGTNGSTAKDPAGRAYTKTVDTGWTDKGSDTISDVLSLWGMTDLGATSTDKFALSVSYDPSVVVNNDTINQGQVVALSTKDANGNWVNAVDKNIGGGKKFVLGPWKSFYPQGYYGVDPGTHTAWAVVNTTGSGQFAVVQH